MKKDDVILIAIGKASRQAQAKKDEKKLEKDKQKRVRNAEKLAVSTCANPVATMQELSGILHAQGCTRQEILKASQLAGIAWTTACTQYGLWLKKHGKKSNK